MPSAASLRPGDTQAFSPPSLIGPSFVGIIPASHCVAITTKLPSNFRPVGADDGSRAAPGSELLASIPPPPRVPVTIVAPLPLAEQRRLQLNSPASEDGVAHALVNGCCYPLLGDRRFLLSAHFAPGTQLYDLRTTPPKRLATKEVPAGDLSVLLDDPLARRRHADLVAFVEARMHHSPSATVTVTIQKLLPYGRYAAVTSADSTSAFEAGGTTSSSSVPSDVGPHPRDDVGGLSSAAGGGSQANPTALVIHRLPPNAQPYDIGHMLEREGAVVLVANVFRFPGPADEGPTGCTGRGYALLNEASVTGRLLHKGELPYVDSTVQPPVTHTVFLEAVPWLFLSAHFAAVAASPSSNNKHNSGGAGGQPAGAGGAPPPGSSAAPQEAFVTVASQLPPNTPMLLIACSLEQLSIFDNTGGRLPLTNGSIMACRRVLPPGRQGPPALILLVAISGAAQDGTPGAMCVSCGWLVDPLPPHHGAVWASTEVVLQAVRCLQPAQSVRNAAPPPALCNVPVYRYDAETLFLTLGSCFQTNDGVAPVAAATSPVILDALERIHAAAAGGYMMGGGGYHAPPEAAAAAAGHPMDGGSGGHFYGQADMSGKSHPDAVGSGGGVGGSHSAFGGGVASYQQQLAVAPPDAASRHHHHTVPGGGGPPAGGSTGGGGGGPRGSGLHPYR